MPYDQTINKAIVVSVDMQPLGHTGTVTMTPIPGIMDFTPPQEEVDDTEVTVYSSEAKEFRPGMFDPGVATIELAFDPQNDVHIFLQGRPKAGTLHAFEVDIPGKGTIEFVGYVKGWQPKMGKRGDVLGSTVPVKVTGAPEYTADPVS